MENKTKKIIALLSVTLFIPIWMLLAETPEEKGWKIAQTTDALPKVQKMTSENAFKIFDSQGKVIFTKRARAATFLKNYNVPDQRLTRSISYFYAPADDKGNGALMIENPGDEEDDQWIYLKGLRKPKRVIGSDKSSSFMGSDFSNGDVAARDINDQNYKWLATETVVFKGKKITVEKVQAIFKQQQKREDYGYSKMIIWMHVQSGLNFRGEMYDLNGQLTKRMELQSFAIVKNRDGKRVFIPTGMKMESMIKGTKTLMEFTNVKVEKAAGNVDPSMFDISYLTRKWW